MNSLNGLGICMIYKGMFCSTSFVINWILAPCICYLDVEWNTMNGFGIQWMIKNEFLCYLKTKKDYSGLNTRVVNQVCAIHGLRAYSKKMAYLIATIRSSQCFTTPLAASPNIAPFSIPRHSLHVFALNSNNLSALMCSDVLLWPAIGCITNCENIRWTNSSAIIKATNQRTNSVPSMHKSANYAS